MKSPIAENLRLFFLASDKACLTKSGKLLSQLDSKQALGHQSRVILVINWMINCKNNDIHNLKDVWTDN